MMMAITTNSDNNANGNEVQINAIVPFPETLLIDIARKWMKGLKTFVATFLGDTITFTLTLNITVDSNKLNDNSQPTNCWLHF